MVKDDIFLCHAFLQFVQMEVWKTIVLSPPRRPDKQSMKNNIWSIWHLWSISFWPQQSHQIGVLCASSENDWYHYLCRRHLPNHHHPLSNSGKYLCLCNRYAISLRPISLSFLIGTPGTEYHSEADPINLQFQRSSVLLITILTILLIVITTIQNLQNSSSSSSPFPSSSSCSKIFSARAEANSLFTPCKISILPCCHFFKLVSLTTSIS